MPMRRVGSATTVLACPICRSHDRRAYRRIGSASQGSAGVATYEVLKCIRHGIEFADALPATTSEAEGLASLIRMYGAPNAPPSPRYQAFMDRVERVARPPGQLHDVGCGNGQLLVEARRRGWGVQGNDIVAAVQPVLAAQGIACQIGELARLDVSPMSCDVVASYCVLPHHLLDPIPDLRAARTMLRPGGWFVAELPDNGPYRRAARALYRLSGERLPWVLSSTYGPGGHQFAYDRENIKALLRGCGFTDIRVEDCYMAARWSAIRFRSRGLWVRIAGYAAVYGLAGISRFLRRPNHMFVYARR